MEPDSNFRLDKGHLDIYSCMNLKVPSPGEAPRGSNVVGLQGDR